MAGLDPQARAVLDLIESAGSGGGLSRLPLAEARALFAGANVLDRADPIAGAEDRVIAGQGGEIPIRAYRPLGVGPFPIVVFLHGGGWTIGDLDSHDSLCRSLAARSGCLVVAVGYRLAPEHRHPAALLDAQAAVEWAARAGQELEGDPARLAIAGDSAGGNLAAVAAILDRDSGRHQIRFQALIYPAVDHDPHSPSIRENADGYFLTRAEMDWFIDNYAGDQDRTQPTMAPLRAASLAGLPPAIVITAEFDPLRDQGNEYARRLEEAGVRTALHCYPGVIHGFMSMRAMIDAGDSALDEVAAAIRAALA